MSRVRSRDTQPEIRVRSTLHRLGFRFRTHREDLPGKPDVVLPKYRAAVFVNGCFWHQHPNCRSSSRPKTRVGFWNPKLDETVARDQRNYARLLQLGWTPIIIWECETGRPESLTARLRDLIERVAVGRSGSSLRAER